MVQDLQKRISRQKQIQAKPGPVTAPYVHMCWGWDEFCGLDQWEGYQDMDPARSQADPHPLTQKMGEIFVSSSFLQFFLFVLIFASADVELTAAARGFRAAASAQGSGDFQRTMKI